MNREAVLEVKAAIYKLAAKEGEQRAAQIVREILSEIDRDLWEGPGGR